MKLLNARKKLVTLAIASAAVGGAMVSAPAQAVNVSQNNVGEVLFYPYYTVKNGYDTIFTVVNTTNRTAIFKIRFREALNSREVRDFNVILSPYDHWGAAVTKDSAGTGAVVRTYDNTCTSPILPASAIATGSREIAFTNYLFAGSNADGGSEAIDRVQEGYFEIFLMGVSSADYNNSANVIEYNAKHVNGVPRNCATVDTQFTNVAGSAFSTFSAPENILKGHVTYIDVAKGKAIDAEPTHLEDWRNNSSFISAPGDTTPSLANGDQTDANMLVDGAFVTKTGAGSPDAEVNTATIVLSADAVINEFATGSGASTSWVLTFPSKHHYTDGITDITTIDAQGIPPFKYLFKGDKDAGGKSCDVISVTLYNREEGTAQPSGTAFSPVQSSSNVELCYEANVIDFNGTAVFGSGTNHLGMTTTDVGTAGWAYIGLTNTGNVGGNTTVTGLPVIGFAAIMRDTGGAAVNYGSSIAHTIVSGN
jgi:hypothetical protein